MAYEIVCADAGYDCDFMIRSEDEDEIVEFVQEHARNVHGDELEAADIQELRSTV